MAFPVKPITRPAILAGLQNGRLPDSVLVDTAGQDGGPLVRLVPPTARKWRALCAAARKAGYILKASGAADSYRPYSVQEAIFRQRYSTTRMAGSLGAKTWNGVVWYQKPGTATAAVPGTSNHGWGGAVDTGQELDGDPGAESIGGPAFFWLLANADRFGFSWELQSEPWHLHDFSGDTIPKAVLDYEASLQPAPPAPTEDDDMATQLVWYTGPPASPGPHCYHLGGIHGCWVVKPEAIALLKFLGVPESNTAAKPLGPEWQDGMILVDGPCKNQ